jgi:preprotein translocase subunit SecA
MPQQPLTDRVLRAALVASAAARGVLRPCRTQRLHSDASLTRGCGPQAYELFLLGKQYIVRDERVIMINEGTGRLLDLTRWQDGLHQVGACAS